MYRSYNRVEATGSVSVEEARKIIGRPFTEWSAVVIADVKPQYEGRFRYGGAFTCNVILQVLGHEANNWSSAIKRFEDNPYYDCYCNLRIAIVRCFDNRDHKKYYGKIVDFSNK